MVGKGKGLVLESERHEIPSRVDCGVPEDQRVIVGERLFVLGFVIISLSGIAYILRREEGIFNRRSFGRARLSNSGQAMTAEPGTITPL